MTGLALVSEINALHHKARHSAHNAVQYAVECGQRLIEAIKAVAHGEWKNWVDQHLDFNQDTSSRYIRAAKSSLATNLDASYLPKLWGHESCANGTAHVSYNSRENEWYTPPEFIASAREVLGSIDIDPASSDKAEAMRADARQAKDDTLESYASKIKIHAERKAGELLRGMDLLKGRPRKGRHDVRLSDVRVNEKQSERWQKIADIPELEFEKAIEGGGRVTTTAVLLLHKTLSACLSLENSI